MKLTKSEGKTSTKYNTKRSRGRVAEKPPTSDMSVLLSNAQAAFRVCATTHRNCTKRANQPRNPTTPTRATRV